MTDQTYSPGLKEPVFDSQAIFRAALSALSLPALKFKLSADRLPQQAPLPPLAAGLALTLLDFDSPAWLSPSWSKAAGWLAFHNGVKPAAPGAASFILAAGLTELPALEQLSPGDERCPERSATVIVNCPRAENELPVYAEGPGLKRPRLLPPSGLSSAFVRFWQANHARYPLGLDLIALNGDGLWALPRSAKLSAEPERRAV
ncbi:MAG: phosphonate C-P lyase system protein PhnH [Candidatus Adiutrix sp.]|jgi:alpha-D-ribose 1-methylphosphonate 5-triphosphate synthase subunit PhnH|nr:phosphonate C-P lyase system protein PhnH [Candidatus Adiutrix sp.]